MEKIAFISGLPRSGSTLLSAILRQNPRFVAGMSSPVFSLVNALHSRFSNANEFNVFFDDDMRARIMRGLFNSYYHDTDGKMVFDTNRTWCARLPLLLKLFPDTKIICCVRPISEIVDSFERLFAKNVLQPSQIFNYDSDMTVYSRADHLMFANGILGGAINGLKEAFYGPNSDRLLLVSYEKLANQPTQTMAKIYDFVSEQPFVHDFKNVAYDAKDFDMGLGVPGLHDVRRAVKYERQLSTLPSDIIARYVGPHFWDLPLEATRSTRWV